MSGTQGGDEDRVNEFGLLADLCKKTADYDRSGWNQINHA